MPLQSTSGAASYDGFGGGVPVVPKYIEEYFSTFLYSGNAGTQTVTNGIDLSTKGGMVWIKSRSGAYPHSILDTVRGFNYSGTQTKRLDPSTTDSQADAAGNATQASPLTDGFSVTTSGGGAINFYNASGQTYTSWSWAKAPKFFDVVTYTGDGTTNRSIAHSLGSMPGFIAIKRTDSSGNWACAARYDDSVWYAYYEGTGTRFGFNSTDAGAIGSASAMATSTVFYPRLDGPNTNATAVTNVNGATYVAYIYAHNAGGFGLTGTDNVISCGSYTGNGSATGPTVTLGYEPQWVLVKRTDSTSSWTLSDNMRGQPVDGATAILFPNLSDAEASATTAVSPTATGFQVKTSGATYNASGGTYIYIAIRRGPMKVPTSGTSVYNAVTWSGNTTTDVATRNIAGIGSPTDLFIGSERDPGFNQNYFYDRLRGTNNVGGLLLVSSTTDSETTNSPGYGQYSFAQQDGITLGNYTINYTGRTYVGWHFKRAPSFFDEVCYTGNYYVSTDFQAVAHNLAVVPELAIIKRRSTAKAWNVYYGNPSQYMELQSTAAESAAGDRFDGRSPTATSFYVGVDSDTNSGGVPYVMYLFATCAGVSKVGSYTGTGSTQTINCGFTGGARFVLIKASSTTGDWYVWDTARGIVSGNDPYLWLNSPYASAEVTNTDWVDTASTGFELSNAGGNLANSNGVSYIFLAIA